MTHTKTKEEVRKWWFGTITTRFPWKGGIVILGAMSTDDYLVKDLWDAGYKISFKKFFGIKYLYAQK